MERGEVDRKACYGCVREREVGWYDTLQPEVRSEEVDSGGWRSVTSGSTLVNEREACLEKVNM